MSESALTACIRIVTESRAFKQPTPMADAIEFTEWVWSQPRCVPVSPGTRHWGILNGLLGFPAIRGPLVTDAWNAALAIEHGCEWITLDRDFDRFPKLTVGSPLNE